MPTPIANMFVISMTNSNEGGVLNIAQFGLEQAADSPPSVAVTAAQLIGYVVDSRAAWLSSGTLITRVQYRAAGSGGFIDVPWPEDEWDTLVANNDNLVAMADYGDTVLGASGGLAPVGTSVCVTERTATFGRHGRGRHFLPFVNKAKVDGAGLLVDTSITAIQDSYERYILTGSVPDATVSLDPCVMNAAHTSRILINSVQAQAVLSNLRSRRR